MPRFITTSDDDVTLSTALNKYIHYLIIDCDEILCHPASVPIIALSLSIQRHFEIVFEIKWKG